MRMGIIAAVAAVGFGFIALSGASAAPASGTVIKATAAQASVMENVWWHRRHCWWRHHRRWCD
jgi:hypothetical protein